MYTPNDEYTVLCVFLKKQKRYFEFICQHYAIDRFWTYFALYLFFGGGLVGFSFVFWGFFCMKLIFFYYHICHSNLNTTFKK